MSDKAAIVREQLLHLGPLRGATGLAALDAMEAERNEAWMAVETLLAWAERYRGGDQSLDLEEWYVASEFARRALARAALDKEQT